MDSKNITGPLKAAILIRSLGTEVSSVILNGLSEEEKTVVNRHLSQMGAVSAEVIEYVAKEFTDSAALRSNAARLAPPPKGMHAEKKDNAGTDGDDESEGLKAIDRKSVV